MKFYHGTPSRNQRSIEEEGFLGSELSDHTDGFSHVEDGVVFLTQSIEEAQEYGSTVFEIHLEGIEVKDFSDGNTDHFYANANEVNEQSWWEVVK
ncbi:MAG: hypothetical protein ACYTEQ_09480 [Planctomycetota bacterium]|jgi:hypothetical protein